jgi:ABC-type phosphate transport system substrate-binding protein
MNRYVLRPLLAATLGLASISAMAQVAVVMNPGAAPLSKDQVANIFLGRNADFKPVDLPESSATRGTFYQKATDRDAAQVKAVWSRLVFSGKAQPPKEVADAAAVKKAVAADPKAIGYIEKSAVDGSVKVVLSLD